MSVLTPREQEPIPYRKIAIITIISTIILYSFNSTDLSSIISSTTKITAYYLDGKKMSIPHTFTIQPNETKTFMLYLTNGGAYEAYVISDHIYSGDIIVVESIESGKIYPKTQLFVESQFTNNGNNPRQITLNYKAVGDDYTEN